MGQLQQQRLEVLMSIGQCDLYEVMYHNTQQSLIRQGTLSVLYSTDSVNPGVRAQVEDFGWLLAKDLPVLKVNATTYTFSVQGRPDIYYCLLLPVGTPMSATEALDAILYACSALKQLDESQVAAPASTIAGVKTERIVSGITKGAVLITQGMSKAAEYAGNQIEKRGASMTDKATPKQDVQIKPETKERVEKLRALTMTTARFSAMVSGKVLDATYYVASNIADKLSQSSTIKKSTSGPTGQAVKMVGVAGIQAASQVFDAMEQAARSLLNSTNRATTHYVHHVYGNDAAELAKEGGRAAKDVLDTAINVNHLTPRGLVKKVAKEVTKQVMLDGSKRKDVYPPASVTEVSTSGRVATTYGGGPTTTVHGNLQGVVQGLQGASSASTPPQMVFTDANTGPLYPPVYPPPPMVPKQ